MYLKKTVYKASGRTFLQICRKYRDGNKSKESVVEKIGYLDELTDMFDDPIAHFEDRAKLLTLQEKQDNASFTLKVNPNSKLNVGDNNFFNFGYSYLQYEYYSLGLPSFFKRKQDALDIQYNLSNVCRLLAYQRILHPSSKKEAFQSAHTFLEPMAPNNIDAIYDALSRMSGWQNELQVLLHEHITELFGKRGEIGYFDCTNYYFEIDQEDALRRKGPSKEHRKTPIIQMGLLIDANGIPMAYHIFPGNEAECKHLRPVINRCRHDYGLDRIVVVADKGLNTSDTMFYTSGKGDGYIYSQTITGSDKEYKTWALDQSDYQLVADHKDNKYEFDENNEKQLVDGFKMKSRIIGKEIQIENENGKRTKKLTIRQKQIIYYSPKYAKRCKALREKVIDKAEKVLRGEIPYSQVSNYGVLGYIKEDVIDENGELNEKREKKNIIKYINLDKIKEQEKYDGYYSLVTSEVHLSDQEVISTYRGLWKIEESFKITKSEFKSRPVYLSRKDRIESHFFICFLSLVIMRMMEYRLKNQYSTSQLIDSIRKHNCIHLNENVYQFIYRDNIIEELDKTYGIDSSFQYQKRKDIKNILAQVKK